MILRPVIFTIVLVLSPTGHATPATAQSKLTTAADPQRDAFAAFKKGRFEQVVRLIETLPPDHDPPRNLLKIGVESYVKLGRPETAFKTYLKFIPSGQPDDARLLREIAVTFVTSHVRAPEEYVRIAAYTALKDGAEPQMTPVLEDGLFDSSALVRTLAAEGLGRALVASTSSKPSSALTALKRAWQDPAPAVRIAAINA